MVPRTELTEAVREIDGKIPKELGPYWSTIKTAIDELPDEVLIELLGSVTKQLTATKQCLIIEDGENLRIVKDIQTFLIKD
jgi:hypothetical protein